MDSIIARKTWRTLEPFHGLIYFVPEAHEAYGALGLDPTAGYFASRSAAMGAVGSETVIATFFNFNPPIVRNAMADVWTATTPELLLSARRAAAGQALARVIGEGVHSPEIAEAAGLARQAAFAAAEHLEGRPLFAAHAALEWPTQPHQVLWHAQMLLREFRGDGHIALLVAEAVSGIESLILHAAMGGVGAGILRRTRGWNDQDWAAGTAKLADRGLVNADGSFTGSGAELRNRIEAQTDVLALAPYQALGHDNCERLRELVRPFAKTISESSFPAKL